MTGPSADSAAATIAVPTTPVEPVEVPAVLSAAVEPARAAAQFLGEIRTALETEVAA